MEHLEPVRQSGSGFHGDEKASAGLQPLGGGHPLATSVLTSSRPLQARELWKAGLHE